MIIDITPYRKYLDVFDLTEEQKYELVNAIWAITENLLDKKYGLSSDSYVNNLMPLHFGKREQP